MNAFESSEQHSRRNFIRNCSILGAGVLLSPSGMAVADSLQYDHFLLGCSSLDAGIQFIKDKTGVEAIQGGKHPNIGTHNALLSLGEKRYLEIIAPDPDAKSLIATYAFLKNMNSPELFMWAARTEDMDGLLKKVKEAGFKNSGISAGSRQRKDGSMLKWRALSIDTGANSVTPFFIEWDKTSPHPALDSPKGCTIENFKIEFPQPEKLMRTFKQLALEVPVNQGINASLQLAINTPKGKFSFPSMVSPA